MKHTTRNHGDGKKKEQAGFRTSLCECGAHADSCEHQRRMRPHQRRAARKTNKEAQEMQKQKQLTIRRIVHCPRPQQDAVANVSCGVEVEKGEAPLARSCKGAPLWRAATLEGRGLVPLSHLKQPPVGEQVNNADTRAHASRSIGRHRPSRTGAACADVATFPRKSTSPLLLCVLLMCVCVCVRARACLCR